MIDRLKTPTVFAPLVTMAGFALCWYIIHHGFFADGRMLDTPIYSGYAEHMKDGQLPYRDFVEVYPPLALPTFLIPGLVAGKYFSGYTEALESLAIFVGLLLLTCLPFVILAPHGFWASINNQTGRPLQIESLGATIWLFAHQVLGTHLHVYFTHGSDNLDGHASLQFGSVMSVLQVISILGIFGIYAL